MRYCIRTLHNGTVFEVFADNLPAANMALLALQAQGFASELWQGSTRLR